MESPVFWQHQLPGVKRLGRRQQLLLIYDQCLDKNPKFKQWRRAMPMAYAVAAGEKLKSLNDFPEHVSQIVKLLGRQTSKDLVVVAVGGGSVGDFAGFFASVFKRGVQLIHVPSTWLAALDSAHGGKTALNVADLKNQIGTFYPANQVFIARSLLQSQSAQQLQSAYGELVKMALLEGKSLFGSLMREADPKENLMWSLLPKAVLAKQKIVKKDPLETKGLRYLLNLGHTVGHVVESNYNLPHGEAVAYGLEFAVGWSRRRRYMSGASYNQVMDCFSAHLSGLGHRPGPPLRSKDFLRRLCQDKKSERAGSLKFVFLRGPGQPVIKEVTHQQVLQEAKVQGWVRG